MKAFDELASGEPTSIPAIPTATRISECRALASSRRSRASLKALGGGEIAMRRVVVMILGIFVPLIAMGCAEVDDVARPVHAGTVSSHTQDRAEVEAADAASEGASPPPAPAKATGELTDGERLFQGVWRLNQYGPDSRLGTLRIDNRDFHADGVHGRYVGYVSIRSDTSPAQVDFTIEDCECNYKGMTSTGIYYQEDAGAIVFAGPAPGEPRPKAFTEPNEMWRMRPLDPATEGDDETPG
jgi:hypothetical protein